MVKVGVIGGTGLDSDVGIFKDVQKIDVATTPYGDPSDLTLTTGKIGDVEVVIMGRHGKKHDRNPSDVNYRANLWTLKQLGCTHVLVTTACGSLKSEIKPGSLVILDQYIDRTRGVRPSTFYKVCHVPQGKPFDRDMQRILEESCQELKMDYAKNGVCVTIEGPRFSTLAESKLYQSWGCDIVNMTAVPEAPLAAELGLIYCSLALVTDYDCWHDDENESVNVELVTKRMVELGEKARKVLSLAIKKLAAHDWSLKIAQKDQDVKTSIMVK